MDNPKLLLWQVWRAAVYGSWYNREYMAGSFTVRDMPAEERPRERLKRLGPDAVSAQELLAVVLGRGVAGQSVIHLAQELLSRFGSLRGVVDASLEQLQEVTGLGPAKALQLKACLEIARRVVKEDVSGKENRNKSKAVTSAQDVFAVVSPLVGNYKKENFFVVSFDNRNRVLGVDRIAVGTVNANLVHPRETFDAAIRRNATHIAVAHNHPSGDPCPSEADIVVTKRLVEAGKLMGIQLLDHVIFSKTRVYSFKENGLL
ncbi:MAG: DNA repair protein RadC [bacterium]